MFFSIPVLISKYISESLFSTFLLLLFKNNGFTYMKIGQWLSTRSDIFSEATLKKLSTLHNNTTNYKFTQEIPNITGLQSSPIGSGCIASVYKCNYQGKPAALKILHPNIIDIEYDLNLFELLANYFIDSDLLTQFRIDVRNQLNLNIEHSNLEILRNNFKWFKNVKIPKVYFSSKNLLIEEFIECNKITEAINKSNFIFIIQNILCKMIFTDRFIHCDLHPGNVMVDNKNNLVLLDAGMCRYLKGNEYINLLDLLHAALFKRNYYKVGELLIKRKKYQSVKNSEMFKCTFGNALFLERDYGKSLYLLRKHNVKLDFTYSSILTSVFCIDGLIRQLGKKPYERILTVLYLNLPYTYFIRKIFDK